MKVYQKNKEEVMNEFKKQIQICYLKRKSGLDGIVDKSRSVTDDA
ncbi:MAG: hypothetical protein ACYCWE_05950 [Eubacteriales bacterium]